MQMPAHVAQDYELTEDSWRALVDGIFPTIESAIGRGTKVTLAFPTAEERPRK